MPQSLPGCLSSLPATPCNEQVGSAAIEALLKERLEDKRAAIGLLLTATQHSWEEAFYVSLARAFGFHTNSTPFEQLARQTPLAYLNKHHDSLFQLTALLLGQSGLLATAHPLDEEEQQLLREYGFLRTKFSLTPINAALWRRAGVPAEVRIRQFARLLQQSEFLFSRLMEESDLEQMVSIFALKSDTTPQRVTLPPAIGRRSVEVLLINVVYPYRYAYHLSRHNIQKAEEIFRLYRQTPAEDNHIIRIWQTASKTEQVFGHGLHTAADTQAALQLYNTRCMRNHCTHCFD